MEKSNGKIMKTDKDEESKWLEFKSAGVLIIGERDRPLQQEWFYEEDTQKLFFIRGDKQEEFNILKLNPKTLILEQKKSSRKVKIWLKKIVS